MSIELINGALLEKILTTLENIEKLLQVSFSHPRGTTLTSVLHLKAIDNPTRIDFLDAQRHRNIPITPEGKDNIIILGVPVTRIFLDNQGPGTVNYDTNRTYGDLIVETPLISDESAVIESAEWPSIFSINLTAIGEDAKVRLTAIV